MYRQISRETRFFAFESSDERSKNRKIFAPVPLGLKSPDEEKLTKRANIFSRAHSLSLFQPVINTHTHTHTHTNITVNLGFDQKRGHSDGHVDDLVRRGRDHRRGGALEIWLLERDGEVQREGFDDASDGFFFEQPVGWLEVVQLDVDWPSWREE